MPWQIITNLEFPSGIPKFPSVGILEFLENLEFLGEKSIAKNLANLQRTFIAHNAKTGEYFAARALFCHKGIYYFFNGKDFKISKDKNELLKGVKKGIEKLNLVLMPSLFILLIALVTYSAIFGNFTGAASFLFTPDLSKVLDADLLLKALGLAMFSMSLGMGTVCTYAANTDKFTNLFSSVFYIIVLNTMVGILMGLVVFSFIPIENASEGPGLIFVSLASLFGSMGVAGQIIGFAFFMALIFAGITSAISIIEPTALFLMNNVKVERPKAVAYCAVFIFVVGFICILSYYKPSAEVFTFFGKSFFDLLDYITSIILMPLGALFFCVFVGWVVPKSTLAENLKHQMPKGVFEIWVWVIRIIVPAAIISVGVYNFL